VISADCCGRTFQDVLNHFAAPWSEINIDISMLTRSGSGALKQQAVFGAESMSVISMA